MNNKKSIMICLFAAGLMSVLISSCGQEQLTVPTVTLSATHTKPITPTPTKTPIPSVTNTFTPTKPPHTPTNTLIPTVTNTFTPTIPPSPPTPTPNPWALLSDGLKIETICLEVSQSYSGPTDSQFSLPIYEIIEEYLSGAGLDVVSQGESCSGTLSFSLIGDPLGAQYVVSGTSLTCYSGANMQTLTTFSVPDNSQLTANSESKIDPPYAISSCNNPQQAPYRWEPLLFRDLGNIWGPEFLYFVLETSTSEITSNYAGSAIAYLRPDLQATLIQDLEHGNEIVRSWVAIGVLAFLRPTYSGTSSHIEWDFPSAIESPDLIEVARTMQPTLIELLDDKKLSVREAAALLLGMIGPDANTAVPTLANALLLEEQRLELEIMQNCPTSCSISFRLDDKFFLAALWAIGQLDGEDAIPTLIYLLRRQVEPVYLKYQSVNLKPGAIRATLSAITGEDFGVSAELWQQWWEARP